MLVISNSEIQKFKQCRRSWYVNYYLERSPKTGNVKPVGATWLGTRMHAALESYYSPALDDIDADGAIQVLREIYTMDTDEYPDYADELLEEWSLADIMLRGYFDWLEETGADSQLEVVGTEREYIAPFTEDVAIRGRLDMVVLDRATGARLFLDHKNVIQFLDEAYLDRDEQAKFYMMLQRLTPSPAPSDTLVDGGIFNQLRKVKRSARAKPPFYLRTTVRHNSATLNSMYLRTYQAVTEIADLRGQLDDGASHEQFAYPHPTKDCAWMCPLASGLCSMMDDGSDWQDFLENEWVHVDPYARYTESSYLDKLEQRGIL
jgi:RecB family exonuclease